MPNLNHHGSGAVSSTIEQPLVLQEKIGFIGGGNMAKAICEGILKSGICKSDQISVAGPHLTNLKWWADKGAHVYEENGKIVDECDVIFLSMKPHILPIAIANVHQTIALPVKSKLFVSVLAGVDLEHLTNVLNPLEECARIIRVMPNTPMAVGEGCTSFTPGTTATPHDIDLVERILKVSGKCMQVPESMVNAFGALAGSGPAYIYLAIEALADAGVYQGLPRAMAVEMAAQMTLGAAKMVLETKKHTGVLKDEVCSPGGSTIRGIHALETGGLRAAFMNAVDVATKRSAEMGKKQ